MIGLEHEMKILALQLKEKDQESKLADMKIKEMKRSLKHKQLKPIGKVGSPQLNKPNKSVGRGGRVMYNSNNDLAGSKILRKKLENGRVTYQDVVLTEENIKLHEKKYAKQNYSQERQQLSNEKKKFWGDHNNEYDGIPILQ